MKKSTFTAVLIFFFIAAVSFADVSLNGTIETETGLVLKTTRLETQTNTLGVRFEYGEEGYHLFANPEIKVSGIGAVSDLAGLQQADSIHPYVLNLKEAYIDIYEFLLPAVDMRVGKQIIVWGTSDRINPTSNLCPSDLSDLFDWGEKLGVTSLLLNIYLGDAIVSGFYTPVFTPALLPENFLEMAGTDLGSNMLEMPGQVLGESQQAALRVNWPMFGYDFSLSYYFGRYASSTRPGYRQTSRSSRRNHRFRDCMWRGPISQGASSTSAYGASSVYSYRRHTRQRAITTTLPLDGYSRMTWRPDRTSGMSSERIIPSKAARISTCSSPTALTTKRERT